MRDELVVYRPNEDAAHITVRIDDETVWLTQQQMAILFNQTKQNISLHIVNCFKEKELDAVSVVKESLTTAKDGKKYPTKYYCLDVIISVGYRVKSKEATQFRIWATRVLKDYLLKGYVLNNRMNRMEDRMEAIGAKVNQLELQLNTHLIPTQGVFFEGQVFDAYVLISKIICSAQKSIMLIDNFVDESVLVHLSKKNKDVTVTLLTKTISKQLQLDVHKANAQYPTILVKQFSQSHDRFLILDKKEVYHLGASLKDLGKKWFAFSKLDQHSVPSMMASISEVL
jgi:hypothetical protein